MQNPRKPMDLRSLSKHVITLVAILGMVGGTGCGKSSGTSNADASDASGAGQGVESGLGAGDAGSVDSPACPPSCDDDDPCTTDSCDTTTLQCVHAPLADGTSCQGRPCTTGSICQGGICLDGPFKVCPPPSDSCHVVGLCSPKTGECDNPNAPEGTTCDDGDLCTYSDECKGGVCAGTRLVCSGAGTVCDPTSGTCPGGFPTAMAAWSFAAQGWPTNGSGIIKSPDGQILAAGSFTGQIDLGSGPIVQDPAYGANNTDVFLAGLDPNTLMAAWTVAFPGPQQQGVTSFAVDGAGHVGVIGSLRGAVFVGGNELDAVYNGDQFILGASAKVGTGQWATRLNLQSGKTDGRTLGLRAIAGDPNGDSFVVCGTVACATSALRPDAGPVPDPAKDLSPADASRPQYCQGGTDVVVARISSSQGDAGAGGGTVLWSDEVGGTNEEYCGTLATDAESNTYVAGTYSFASDVEFGKQASDGQAALPALPVVDHAAGTAWMFLAKLDSRNRWAWAQGIGTGSQTIAPQAMTAFGSDVIVAGTVNGGSSFGGVALNAPTFIARFDGATGSLVWVKGIGSGTVMTVKSLAEEGGHLLVSGSYGPSCTSCAIGAVALATPGASGGFIAQIDASSGAVVAAKGFGTPLKTNGAAGVIGLDQSTGNLTGSILLLTFSSQLDLGPPIGVVTYSVPDGGATDPSNDLSCFARLGP